MTRTAAVLTAIGTVIAAVAGLLVAFGDVGILGGGDGSPPTTQPAIVTGSSEPSRHTTADAIAGVWSGTPELLSRTYRMTLVVRRGCEVGDVCGDITVANCVGALDRPCSSLAHTCDGRVVVEDADASTVELHVFFPPGNPSDCVDGAGHFFTPRGPRALLYETAFNLRGILTKSSG
jgi:hypothetical protein